MRAQFVYEKFTEETDPIKDMHIGYGKKAETTTFKTLLFIASKGKEGASLTEIQHYIFTEIWGGSEKDFWKKEKVVQYGYCGLPYRTRNLRKSRGTYGAGLYHLLYKWCKKNPDNNKWVLKRLPKPEESLYEKFTQDTDPVSDLDIGIKTLMRKDNEYIKSNNIFKSAEYLFGNETFLKEMGFVHVFLKLYLELKNPTLNDAQSIYDTLAKAFNIKHKKIVSQPSLLKFFRERYNLKLKRYS